jgi:hypothetical protein
LLDHRVHLVLQVSLDPLVVMGATGCRDLLVRRVFLVRRAPRVKTDLPDLLDLLVPREKML